MHDPEKLADFSDKIMRRNRGFRMRFLREFIRFMLARKKYWLVPVFLILLLVGGAVVLSKGSIIAPMIYTIF